MMFTVVDTRDGTVRKVYAVSQNVPQLMTATLYFLMYNPVDGWHWMNAGLFEPSEGGKQ